MRVVAAVHALWLCGTEKCPFDFATDGDSADSENKARMDLFLSFSTADAVDIRSELTRVVRLEADRLVGPVVALAEQNAIGLVRAVVASSHTCKETFRGIAAEGRMPGVGAGGAHDYSVDCPSPSMPLLYAFPGLGGRSEGDERG